MSALWGGTGVVAYAMHPGWTETQGVKSSIPGFWKAFGSRFRSVEQGADTIVYLALEVGLCIGKSWVARGKRGEACCCCCSRHPHPNAQTHADANSLATPDETTKKHRPAGRLPAGARGFLPGQGTPGQAPVPGRHSVQRRRCGHPVAAPVGDGRPVCGGRRRGGDMNNGVARAGSEPDFGWRMEGAGPCTRCSC